MSSVITKAKHSILLFNITCTFSHIFKIMSSKNIPQICWLFLSSESRSYLWFPWLQIALNVNLKSKPLMSCSILSDKICITLIFSYRWLQSLSVQCPIDVEVTRITGYSPALLQSPASLVSPLPGNLMSPHHSLPALCLLSRSCLYQLHVTCTNISTICRAIF